MLVRPDDFAEMNRIYGSYFSEGKYPARTTVIVGELPSESLLEIEMRRRWNNFVFRACACIIPGYA